jgi:hypothetical protein
MGAFFIVLPYCDRKCGAGAVTLASSLCRVFPPTCRDALSWRQPPRVAKVTVSDFCTWLRCVVTIVEFCQQSRGALLRMRGRLIFTPPEEVSMSPSCFIKGLLIAENAG